MSISTRLDLYQQVTDRIIEALQAGTSPWVCPWKGGNPTPINLSTKKPYRGINVLLLNLQAIANNFRNNQWLTFNQAKQLGGKVRRGEQGVDIVFFKMVEFEDDTKQESTDPKVIPLLRTYSVFNIDQIEGLPSELVSSFQKTYTWEGNEKAEQLITDSGAVISYGGIQAFYQPNADVIQLPDMLDFKTASDYYATALHELTHWTGHQSRCNRTLTSSKTIHPYAFEELVAEMGAAFLCAHCQIPGQLQHESYIASWLKALKDDKRLIFTAASLAQKAADYLLHYNHLEPTGTLALLRAA